MKAILILILYTSTGVENHTVPLEIEMVDCIQTGEAYVRDGWFKDARVAGYTCKEQR